MSIVLDFQMVDEFIHNHAPCKVITYSKAQMPGEWYPQLSFEVLRQYGLGYGVSRTHTFHVKFIEARTRDRKLRFISRWNDKDVFEFSIDDVFCFYDDTNKVNFMKNTPDERFICIEFANLPSNTSILGWGVPEMTYGIFRIPQAAFESMIRCFPNAKGVKSFLLRRVL